MFRRKVVLAAATLTGLFAIAALTSRNAASAAQVVKGTPSQTADAQVAMDSIGCTHDVLTVWHGCPKFAVANYVDSVTTTVYMHNGTHAVKYRVRGGLHTDAVFISKWAAQNFLLSFYRHSSDLAERKRGDSLAVQLQHATDVQP